MVHGFDVIQEQPRAMAVLSRLKASGRLPHALLFTGLEGVGKTEAANLLAMACNCSAGGMNGTPDREALAPCGTCSACHRIQARSHPDVLTVAPGGTAIKIGQIRELLQILAYQPYHAQYRFVILSQAEKMNPAAANAFLKVLEEPPPRTFLILITPQKTDLLPTILSRCQIVHFQPLNVATLTAKLLTHDLCSEQQARIIAEMAGGSWSQARQYTESTWLQRRQWLLASLANLGSYPLRAALRLAEKLAANKSALEVVFLILETWLRDVLLIRYDTRQVINQDWMEVLQRVAGNCSEDQVLNQLQALQTARHHLHFNANTRLTLEMLFLQIAQKC